MNHDDRIGTGRWVDCACQEHEAQCKSGGRSIDENRVAQNLITGNANKCAAQMPSEQCARLRGWNARETK